MSGKNKERGFEVAHIDETESRASRYQRKKRSKLGQVVIVIGLTALLAALTLLIPSDTAQVNIHAADEAVKQLYLDDERVYLNPAVTQAEIASVIEEVETLVNSTKDPVYQQAVTAQKKHQALGALKQIYASEVELSEEAEEDKMLVLKEDVTAKTVENLRTDHPLAVEDPMTLQIEAQFDAAEHVLANVEKVTTMIETIPQELEQMEDLSATVAQVETIETILEELKEQPHVEAIEKTLDESLTDLCDYIKANSEEIIEDETLLEELFSSPSLASKLSGSNLDSRQLVALTFDDGPNPDTTPQLLEVLAKYNVKGTFFVLGAEVEIYPELTKQIVEEGHIIANHSYNHPNFDEVSEEEVLAEIEMTQEAIFEATDFLPTLYRMPYGAGGARVVNLLPEMTSIIWNIDSEDWASQDAYVIYEEVMENLLQHSLLLMHDRYQATVDALDLLIPALQEQDYQFVTPLEIGMEDFHY